MTFRLCAVATIAIVALLLIVPINILARQQDSTVEWKLTLQELEHRLVGLSKENPTGIDTWHSDADGLRDAIASFASSHQEIQIAIPDRLPEKPVFEELAQQLNKLTAAVDQVIKESPGSPFHLGTETVVVSVEASAPALVSDSIDHAEIAAHDFRNIAKAFDYMPGVEIEHIAPRNEAGIRVRGFTTRGQVPFYLDGIPISVPYDGYVDFNRFLTGDIAQLQVTKGYSSPLLGPNALGGTINVVTHEPIKKLEGEALLGTGSGNTLISALRLGSRWQRFFVQGSLNWLQNDFVPLSGKFQVNQYTRLPDIRMTDRLNHSSSLDNRYTGRLGWTPRGEDEYVAYDFTNNPAVSQVRTSIVVLPPLPRNKFTGTATVRAVHDVLGMASVRYEGGLTLQDTTYAAGSAFSRPFGEALATVDIGTIVPFYKRATVQLGVKNLLDRNYFYVAGYPEAGRNWFLNLRYQF